MVQSEGFLSPFVLGLLLALKAGAEILKKEGPTIAKNATKYFVKQGIIELNKKLTIREGSGMMPTNNEIKYIMKAIRSLENRGILLKGTTTKLVVKKGNLLIFLYH